MMPVINPAGVLIPETDLSPRLQQVMSNARVVRCAAIIDSLFCLLFIVGGVYYMVAVIILPILGYAGARSMNRGLTLLYLIYLISIIGVRIGLIAMVGEDAYTAI